MSPECETHDCERPADLRVVVYDHADTQMRITRDVCVECLLDAYVA